MIDLLDQLGLSVDEFLGMDPTEKFKTLATAVSKFEDPTQRSNDQRLQVI